MGKREYNTNTMYNYGSSAPDIYRDVNLPPVREKQMPQKSRQGRKLEKRQAFRQKFVIMTSIVVIFAASVTFVWGCALMSSKQYSLKQDKDTVRQLKNQVNIKKALIASDTNLDHIKLRASKELNMGEPLPHQIVYLDIKKTSYTVIDKGLQDNDKGW